MDNITTPLFITKYSNCTEDLNLLAMDLELYPFLEYEGWKKWALIWFVSSTFAIEVFMKILLAKFSKENKILERPITVMFIVDQAVQGTGYIVVTLLFIASVLTGIPMVKMFGSTTVAWVFVGFCDLIIVSKSTMSLMMAIYRLLCLKANHFTMYKIGGVALAIILIFVGYGLTFLICLAWLNNNPSYISGLNFAKGVSQYQALLIQKYTEEKVNQAVRENSYIQ